MKTDVAGMVLRWVTAWLLLSLTALFLYLAGTAQSFLDSTLADAFRLVRWLTWLGLLGSLFLLLPLTRRPRHRRAALALGLAFGLLFAFVLVWGGWLYPKASVVPW